MKKLVFIILSFSGLCFSQDFPEELYFQITKSETRRVRIKSLDELRVSTNCFDKKKSCQKFFSAKQNIIHYKSKLSGNPASIFCAEKKGVSVILRDDKKNEYDFCQFNDEYLIDSWDLFRKYNK